MFVARPHKDIGRDGPVCPFVPVAWEHKTLWLAAERSAGRSAPDVIQRMDGYKRMLLAAQPVDGDDANYKSIVVVFTDLPAAQAKDFYGGLLQLIGVPSYVDDGLVMGRAVSVDKACGYQRLEVLLEQRRLAQALGASLWRIRGRSSCRRTTSPPVAREAQLIERGGNKFRGHCTEFRS